MTVRGVDPDYIRDLERFEGFSHERIYRHAQAMDPGEMHRAAATWVSIADGMFGALTVLHAAVQGALSEGMAGHIADAAEGAARRFVGDATDIAEIIHSTGRRMTAAAYGAEAVRRTVPPPMDRGSVNVREEQRQIALAALDANYVPIYPAAGAGIPAFFDVMTPGGGVADGEDLVGSGSDTGDFASTAFMGGASRTGSATADHIADSSNPRGVDAHSVGSTPASSNPQRSQALPNGASIADSGKPAPSAETDANVDTKPATLDPGGDPLTPTFPSGAPTPAGTPSWPRAVPAAPDPGRSYPGPVNPENPSQSRIPGSSTQPAPGTGMLPGMFAPGGRAAREGESTHRTPEWLIRDRQDELLGDPLPYVPQTIGAEILAARNDLTLGEDDLD
ncbi:hypothetical protein VMT65_08130 [Nocardia sp. CDC153]|uniref:hypothetical protein n=1 Tax=Nocardia sp. CDC153 TaxID=3112167 RepID=UPI002DBE98CF|nr:hypothetical protein [Nocardia sp. CDC153]MEC3952993.1 hypothetical protein [Nocardia sp. CDC153]